MKLPNIEEAVVRRSKIVEYLLSEVHPTGHDKSEFFGRLGFQASAWEDLARALVHHAKQNDVESTQDTEYGKRYVVEGVIAVPRGGSAAIRAVWFVDRGAVIPRLITAYPMPENQP